MSLLMEKSRLAQTADFYDSRKGLSNLLVSRGAEIILARARGPRLLELGCANGVMTEIFAARFPEVTVVEGAESYAAKAREILGKPGEVHCCLFEEFVPSAPFDDIVLAGVLEHVLDPVELLRRASGWLTRPGRLHILVPHAHSLHRLAGVTLGLLSRPEEMHAGDRAMGHRRVYTWKLLETHILESGLEITARDGNFLKPLSNAQMEDLPEALLEDARLLGREYPELAAEIYALCLPTNHQ
jgi:trans-aconitate methyltransferase